MCGRSTVRPRQEPHDTAMAWPGGSRGKEPDCDRGSGDIVSGKSVAPMFVEVSVLLVEPRRQDHNFYICPEVAAWVGSTVFGDVCLAVKMSVELFSVSEALAAHVTVLYPCPTVESSCAVPPLMSVES